jgi:hypothetical protein
MPVDLNAEETLLARYVIDSIQARATGAAEAECIRNYPHDVYFVGNLCSVQTELRAAAAGGLGRSELQTKIAPFAFGGQFRLRPDSDALDLQACVSWSVYYRVLPSLAQQREFLQQQFAPSPPPDSPPEDAVAESPEALDARQAVESGAQDEPAAPVDEADQDPILPPPPGRRRRPPEDSLFPRFRKISCEAHAPVRIAWFAGIWQADSSQLLLALKTEMARAVAIADADPERARTGGEPTDRIQVPQDVLLSEAGYLTYLRSLTTEIAPRWDWGCTATVEPENALPGSPLQVSIELVNISPDDRSPNREPFIFDSHLALTFPPASLLPFELDIAPRGFRYDRLIWGRGFNCGLVRSASAPATIRTTHTPVFPQLRLTTKTQPRAGFAELAADPFPALREILAAMVAYRDTWEEARRQYRMAVPDWQETFGAEFDADAAAFDDELLRYRRGLERLERDADALLAFRLTNESFLRAGQTPVPGKRRDSWRLFQVVFIVTQVPGITALATRDAASVPDRRIVDIIYFPTGGGKTEAYLGTLVFHCFYDRLRGKGVGTTAWTRFPLRLLTLQQTQRIADIVCSAELVRQSQSDRRLNGPNVDGFSVGYFVGEAGSPNEIADPQKVRFPTPNLEASWAKACDPTERQEWRRVIYCPACRTKSIQIDFDQVAVRLIHRCTTPRCPFPGGQLPVMIVDNEIYRYLPTVLVGTIDKLAAIGNQRKFSQLFGRVDGRCRVHGFYKGKCSQKDCADPRLLDRNVPPALTGPSLFIQDELHLLKEGLGTFDGHYETFLQRLRNDFGDDSSLKIIASSATVEAFERQIEHLYGRDRGDARVFPSVGPTLGESFYIETQSYPQRLYVGILPHNKTIFNSILELLEGYHCTLAGLSRLPAGAPNPYGGQLQPGTADWQECLDFYRTSLVYFLAQRELDSIGTDIEGDVNPNLEQDRLPPLNKLELKGSTRTDEVTRILELLETPRLSGPPDCVLATSMVSHGVDVDRLNAMFFYGMPRQTAEYIQASSRVGRSHVGVVFAVLHPIRERDRSHYTYFAKYHEFLGLLVEPVAINRWARFSVNRTLPGLFMAVLLQRLATQGNATPERYYMLDFLKQKLADGTIRAADFTGFLEEAYLVARPTATGEQVFQDEIRLRVPEFLDQILAAGSSRFVSEALSPGPMRSLRDVDEPISITLDDAGSAWAARQP